MSEEFPEVQTSEEPIVDSSEAVETQEPVESTESLEVSEDAGVQSETKEELKQEIEEAVDSGATEEEVREMIEEFQLKVNGKEYTRKLDLSDKEAVKRELQLSLAGQQAMQRNKELEKIYQDEIEQLRTNPWKVLEELGLNPDELAETRLRAKVEEMQKSPEQIEREKMQQELEEARQELKAQREAADRDRADKLDKEASVNLENEILTALDSHTTLPKSPKTIQRIADAMLWAVDNGFEDVSAADVLPSVEKEFKTELNEFMSELPIDVLQEYIGKQTVEKLRQNRLNKMRPNNINNIKPTTESVKTDQDKKVAKKIKSKNYFKNL